MDSISDFLVFTPQRTTCNPRHGKRNSQRATRNATRSESRRWSPFAKGCFAGGIFGDMLFELFAPQGLKCPAAAVQRVDFGEIGKFAQQITKSNFTGGHTCVFGHISPFNDPTFGFWIISSD